MATDPVRYLFQQEENVTNPSEFMRDLRTLLDDLRSQASYSSPHKVATGNRSTADFQTIYALVQSSEDCANCLVTAARQVGSCCSGSTTVSMFLPSCMIYYDVDPSFNGTRIQELESVTTTPVISSPPGNNESLPLPPTSTLQGLPSPSGNGINNTGQIIIIIGSVAAGVILAIIIGVLLKKRRTKKAIEELGTGDEISMVDSLQYDFKIIRAATDNFSKANELGQGGFRSVYKGVLRDGQEIAVKRLSKDSSQGELEFKNEVLLLANLQHRNLVRLLGFSIEENEKLLVYEFLRNASVDQFIFDPTRRSTLQWDTRYKIIGGTARGLLYLHEDSRLRIIHRDLKASNVLLDDELNPKIADFGTARLFVQEETQANTCRIVGTFGYMAPEYALHGQISTKSDVFSFGVLILEIISGQKNSSFCNKDNVKDYLKRAAWRLWRNGTISDLVDPMLIDGTDIQQSILRCIHIGLLCVQEDATDRPAMDSVVRMLKNLSMDLPKPSEPAFSMGKNYDSEASLLQDFHSHQTDETSRTRGSFISDVHPR